MSGNFGSQVCSQKENLVTNCQTNSNRLSFFLTRALGSRVGPDFAGQDGRKTGSWEEGGQQGFSLMSSEEFVENFHQKEI